MKDKIFKTFKKYILYWAHKKYPNIRKRKYSLEYYLNNFIFILNDVCKWDSLKITNGYNGEYHYKTIYNEYNKWCKDNIFTNAFDTFIKENYFKISKVRQNKKLTLFIDVVKINNLYGSEYIYIDNENKKKNITPLTFISDNNGLSLAYRHIDINRKIGKRKTHVHEINNSQHTLDKIDLKVKKYVDLTLTGDKAYISNRTYNALTQTIKIITPKRKNQKSKNTKKEKKLLSERFKIEHLNCKIKKYNRIYVRKDKKFNNYISFTCMAFLMMYFDFIDKMDINDDIINYIEKKYDSI
jgi:hypothetical protein